MAAVSTWQAPSTSTPRACHRDGARARSRRPTGRWCSPHWPRPKAASTVSGALRSRDTDLMIGALRTLGVAVDGAGTELTVSGADRPARRRARRLRPGGHGAAVRAAGRRAGHRRRCSSTATSRPGPARSRRCSTRCAGSAWTSTATACRSRCAAPGRWPAARCEIDASASSQFVSGSAAVGRGVHRRADDRAHRRVGAVGAARRDDGVDAARRGRRRRRQRRPTAGGSRPGPIAARHWAIEPDLSNAVPFLAAAVVSGGIVRIAGWPPASIAARRRHPRDSGEARFRCAPG